MDLEEQRVDPHRGRRPRERRDEAAVAGRRVAARAGHLHGVRRVHADRHAELAHLHERAHVHDEVAVAEGGTALGQEDVRVPGLAALRDGVAHLARREELSLLHVHRAAVPRAREHEVRLTAQEGRHLDDVDHAAGGLRLPGLVHVGEAGQSGLALHRLERGEPDLEARAPVALARRAVRLVEARLEDGRETVALRERLHLARVGERVALVLHHAGAGDEEELLPVPDEVPADAGEDRLRHLDALSDGQLRWADNDLTDMMYLTSAAGYCDYVVGERAHTSHIANGLRRLGRAGNLHPNLRSLVTQLRAA